MTGNNRTETNGIIIKKMCCGKWNFIVAGMAGLQGIELLKIKFSDVKKRNTHGLLQKKTKSNPLMGGCF